jgi:drug/metabolite transporter (DMT)-like permease|tara:strand:- start:2 stop:892 length:891 start_codon:yes stop_codon:yes gene_type:complete
MMPKFNFKDIYELLILSAIWGSSFLFLRLATPVFGPIFLIEMRVVSGLVVLFPMVLILGKFQELKSNWRMIALVSLLNMAIPFCFFAYSALYIGAGLLSIINATVPIFTAVVAWSFYNEKLTKSSLFGLALGFIGVVSLVFNPFEYSGISSWLAIPSALFACLLYGVAINLAANNLKGVSGLTITAGGLLFSTIVLLPFSMAGRPEVLPQGSIWWSVFALGVVCTGFGFVMFYRLVDRVGTSRAIMTTYLIPIFSIFWGNLFLSENVTLNMVFGCVLVLLGVGLTTGAFPWMTKAN